METSDKQWEWPEARWREPVERIRAGRRLTPDTWPGGARVAVGLSFDSDHESIPLIRGRLSAGPLSQGEYGARASMPRIRALLRRHGIPATFFVPAVVAQLHPDEQRALAEEGHEIALHGWIHELNSKLDRRTELDLTLRAAEVLHGLSGRRPTGIRTPSWDFSAHTLSVIQELSLLYDSSLMADDEPYEILDSGEPSGVVELPVEWIRDDYVYFGMDRYSTIRPHTPPSSVTEIFKREFDGAYRERGTFILTMHPHVIGHRSRITILEELIEHISGHEGVWFATHEQIAEACADRLS
ncbi:MAG: polysaccharide deacetylase [Actinomycetota bacterium]